MMATSAVAGAWPAVTKTTVAWLGFELRTVVWRAEHTVEELLLVRIQKTRREAAGWPETMPATRFSSGRARAQASAGFQRKLEQTARRVRFPGMK